MFKKNEKLVAKHDNGGGVVQWRSGDIFYARYDENAGTVTVSKTIDGEPCGNWFTSRFVRAEKAKKVVNPIDFTKPLKTRGGRDVTLVTTTARDTRYPVLAYLGESTSLSMYTSEGKFYFDGSESDCDLMNVPEEIVMYMNVYPGLVHFPTREQADAGAGINRIGCNRVVLQARYDE